LKSSLSPAKQDKTRCVIRSIDYSKQSGVVAVTNGSEENGVKIINLEELLASESARQTVY